MRTLLSHGARQPAYEDALVSQPRDDSVGDRPRGFRLKALVSQQALFILVGYEGELDEGGRHFRVPQHVEPSILDTPVGKPGRAYEGQVYRGRELLPRVACLVVIRLRAAGGVAVGGVAVNGHERCSPSVVGSHHARSEGHRGVFRPGENDVDSLVSQDCSDPRCHGEIDVGLARPGFSNRAWIVSTALVARVKAHGRCFPEHLASPPRDLARRCRRVACLVIVREPRSNIPRPRSYIVTVCVRRSGCDACGRPCVDYGREVGPSRAMPIRSVTSRVVSSTGEVSAGRSGGVRRWRTE